MRRRPTAQLSFSDVCRGIGYCEADGLSTTSRPGAFCRTARAASTVMGFSNSALTATECERYTGTRTQVTEATRDLFAVVYAPVGRHGDPLSEMLARVADLLARHCGATVRLVQTRQ